MPCVRRLMVKVNLQDCKPSFSSDNHTNQYLGLQTCNWKSGLGFSSFSFQYYLKWVLPRPKISSSEVEDKGTVTQKKGNNIYKCTFRSMSREGWIVILIYKTYCVGRDLVSCLKNDHTIWLTGPLCNDRLFICFKITEEINLVIMNAEKVRAENALGSLTAQLVAITFAGTVPHYFFTVTLFCQRFLSWAAL